MDPSKINMFLSWKADRIDAEAEKRKRDGKFESLQQLGQQLAAVQRIWESYILRQCRGEMMDPVGDGIGRGQLPADCLLGLEKVRVQVGQFLQTPVSIGVGMSVTDADQALLLARFRGGDQILIWDEDSMHPELEEVYEQARKEKMETLQKGWPKDEAENQANYNAHLVTQDWLQENGRESGVQKIPMPKNLTTQDVSKRRAQSAYDANRAATPPGWRGVPHAGAVNIPRTRALEAKLGPAPVNLGTITGGWEDDPNDPVPGGSWAKADARRNEAQTWRAIDSATQHEVFPIPELVHGGRNYGFSYTHDTSSSTGGAADDPHRIVEVYSYDGPNNANQRAWHGYWDPRTSQWAEGRGWTAGEQGRDRIHQHLTDFFAKNPMAKSLRKAGADAEQTPANKPNAGGGFTGRHEPGAEAPPMKPIVEGSEHSQGEVARHELSARPTVEGTHAASLEEEFHEHAQAQEDSDKQEQQQQEQQQSSRAKIIQLLQQVKEAAPQLEQLQQQAPGIYQVLLEMTQALILAGRTMVEADRQQAVQKSEQLLSKAWQDPKTQDSMAVFQDAAMEGRGEEIGARPIPMPPGVSPKRPTARPRSNSRGSLVDTPDGGRVWDPVADLPRPGWELTPAASKRTVAADRQGNRVLYGGDEPAGRTVNIHAMGRDVVHDRDSRGGFQGDWDRAQNDPTLKQYLEGDERRFWGRTMEQAQNQAFPIPDNQAQHSSGTPVDHTHQYTWNFHPESGSWGIDATAGDPQPRAWTRAGRFVAGYFEIDPETGLTGKYHAQGGYNESNMRNHLDAFLSSLKGMHKKEMEALEKGKLPMPENKPKHIRQNWPLGWTKGDGKIKVQHPEDGKTTWVSVRAGQVLSNDGHAISSRNPSGR